MNRGRPGPLSIYLVAGEASGDALGAALARALLRRDSGVRLAGVGGEAMAGAGIASPFPIEDLSIIGLSAIPGRLPTILRRIRQTADAIVAAQPDALVIIDSPDFTHRVARAVRRRAPSIPILDYVSPTVWAWRPWRARSMRRYIDCVLAILPFEPAEHLRLGGPPCVYVGHPLIERLSDLRPNDEERAVARRIRRRSWCCPAAAQAKSAHCRSFGAAITQVMHRAARIELVLPTMPHLLSRVREATSGWPVQPRLVTEPEQKWAAFRIARAALAASGTVTLELALAGVPTVAAYKISWIEEMIAQPLLKVQSVILANLVIGENVVPEFLQRDCTPENLARALLPLLSDTAQRQRQVEGFQRMDSIMGVGAVGPSSQAADIVLEAARSGRHGAEPLRSSAAVKSAGNPAPARRCRADAAGRASAVDPRSFLSTARSSRRCERVRTAP